jgi:hypothetical protein
MKKTHQIGLMTALLAGIAFTTYAQDPVQSASTPASSDKEFRLSVGPEFGLPIGNFSNAYNWAFGGSVQADIPILSRFYVTVNAGYDDAFVKTNTGDDNPGRNLQLIPVKAGLKYFFFDDLVYVQGQAGATFLGNKTDAGADKSAGFTYSPQVGVLVKLAPKNYIDAGFYWQQTQSFWTGESDLNTLGVRLAYSFGL